MDRKEIYKKLTEIFREVLDNDEIVLKETTSANDIQISRYYSMEECWRNGRYYNDNDLNNKVIAILH